MSSQQQGKNHRAAATVTFGDANGSPVGGVAVSGLFSGATSDNVSGMTDGGGKVTLNSSSTRQNGTWTFCVTDVALEGWIYNQGANVETCDGITTP